VIARIFVPKFAEALGQQVAAQMVMSVPMMARVDMVHVPYKGAAPSVVDLVAGHVHLVFSSPPSVMPQVRTHRLRALAVTTAKRVAAMPELPTIAESGLPALIVTEWYGLLAPAGTRGNITARLNNDIVSTLQAIGCPAKAHRSWPRNRNVDAAGLR
jgi:tripartite-type tricarboxylate transporter receptor subunit TctC